MFLRKIFEELKENQLGFQWRQTIDKLLAMDISTKLWRMEFILEVLKHWRSIWFTIFIEDTKVADLKIIKKLLVECKSYHSNNVIIKWKLKKIIEMFSYEIIKENNNEFDYSLIKEIINWKKELKDFLSLPSEDNVKMFSFTGKSWKIYNWKWVIDLSTLVTDDVIDILEWLKSDNEEVKKAVEYLLTVDKKEINKNFKSFRAAWMSLLADIVQWNTITISKDIKENEEDIKDNSSKKWKLLTFLFWDK